MTRGAKDAARDGHKANEVGDYPTAARLFEEAFRLAPGEGPPAEVEAKAGYLLSAANMYLKQSQLAQAKERYTQLLALPRLSDAMRAKCEEKLHDPRFAEASVKASWTPTLLDEETDAQRQLR